MGRNKAKYDRVIRISTRKQIASLRKYYKENPNEKPWKGITNLNVGTHYKWWKNYIQIHFGRLYFSVQIKWWLIVTLNMILTFLLGLLVGELIY